MTHSSRPGSATNASANRDGREGTPTPRKISRRAFGGRVAWTGLGGLALVAGLPSRARPEASAAGRPTTALLEESPFVYISPLRSNGEESTCHAELWYAWLDGAVVVTVARDRWKASAIARGFDRARIWVGDHGRWKTWYGGSNEAFRQAPRFDAIGERVKDDALLERLLAIYEHKYPDEIADWRDRMRQGNADGTRVLLRYTPVEESAARLPSNDIEPA